jgi:hypothetical protein
MHNRVFSVLPAAVAVAAALAVAGCGAAESGDADIPGPLQRPADAQLSATPTATPTSVPSRVSPPVRIVIPSIRVDASLVRLGLDSKGALEVPKRFDVAGWWTGGARPGERGPAVITGHVDSTSGAAVFYELGALREGDRVIVRRGTSMRFTVQRTERYTKAHFPTARVYGPTRRPTLRLITCSGRFDYSTRHYLDDTVVYATA